MNFDKINVMAIGGGSISHLPISIFLIQNIGDIDIDILYCSALWPTDIFQYRQQSSQWWLYWTVLKIMDAGYCLYVHIFMKNIKSLKTFNFNNSNQLMPDLRFQRSRRDN